MRPKRWRAPAEVPPPERRGQPIAGRLRPLPIALGIRAHTVRTHLERVCAKRGVETRHAAGLRAIEILGVPRG